MAGLDSHLADLPSVYPGELFKTNQMLTFFSGNNDVEDRTAWTPTSHGFSLGTVARDQSLLVA